MDSNKDEAEHCIDIAVKLMSDGKLERARKFLLKADKLYPSEKSKRTLRILESLPNYSGQREKSPVSKCADEKKEDVEQIPHIDYTVEQMEAVNKVKSCKTHYEVLGVVKTSTDSDVKRAYKKLALLLHPDKNKAPGAVEAFKKVGAAAAILTDAEKRKNYDLFGSAEASGRVRHEYARYDPQDMSADELFNMFFGSGMGQSNVYMRQHRRRQQAREEQDDQNLTARIFNTFPLFILIILSLISSMIVSDPVYSLSYSSDHPIKQQTSQYSIPYYLKRSAYPLDRVTKQEVESLVLTEYVDVLVMQCDNDRHDQKLHMQREQERGHIGDMRKAREIKIISCEKLEALRSQINA